MPAHRYSWEFHNGPIPAGLDVLHRCDNRPCVNPAHLFVGTPVDNALDMVAKGRDRHAVIVGEASKTAKLTEADVREIRRLHGTMTRSTLAQRFGVSISAIDAVLSGRNWRHVE